MSPKDSNEPSDLEKRVTRIVEIYGLERGKKKINKQKKGN